VRELVAVAVPGGPAFVDTLRRIWDRGDALLPLDPRLPGPALDALIEDPVIGAEAEAMFLRDLSRSTEIRRRRR